MPYTEAWPEPNIYSVYDRIFGDFPAKSTVYILYIIYIRYIKFWPTLLKWRNRSTRPKGPNQFRWLGAIWSCSKTITTILTEGCVCPAETEVCKEGSE